MNAIRWFKNNDKIIEFINKNRTDMKLFYSTVSCYLSMVNQSSKSSKSLWPVKNDDFFPYATAPPSYWTGYFSSRPTFKGFVREVSAILQTCKQIATFGNVAPGSLDKLSKLNSILFKV